MLVQLKELFGESARLCLEVSLILAGVPSTLLLVRWYLPVSSVTQVTCQVMLAVANVVHHKLSLGITNDNVFHYCRILLTFQFLSHDRHTITAEGVLLCK